MPLFAPLPPIARAVAVYVLLSTGGRTFDQVLEFVSRSGGLPSPTSLLAFASLLQTSGTVIAFAVAVAVLVRLAHPQAVWWSMLLGAVIWVVSDVLFAIKLSSWSSLLNNMLYAPQRVVMLWLTYRLLQHPLARSAKAVFSQPALPLESGPVTIPDQPAFARAIGPGSDTTPTPAMTPVSGSSYPAASGQRTTLAYATGEAFTEPLLRTAAIIAFWYALTVCTLQIAAIVVWQMSSTPRLQMNLDPGFQIARLLSLTLVVAIAFATLRTTTLDQTGRRQPKLLLALAAPNYRRLVGALVLAEFVRLSNHLAGALANPSVSHLVDSLIIIILPVLSTSALVYYVARAGDPPRGISGVR